MKTTFHDCYVNSNHCNINSSAQIFSPNSLRLKRKEKATAMADDKVTGYVTSADVSDGSCMIAQKCCQANAIKTIISALKQAEYCCQTSCITDTW